MPNDNNNEPFDLYADQFIITITPFGANLSFAMLEPHPSAGRQPQTKSIGTIRMSVEHLKMMVMIIRRQVLKVEGEAGVTAEVPHIILNQIGISPDDWNSFWRTPN